MERVWLAAGTWLTVALVPLTVQALQRASGRTDRAQEEVLVVEQAGARLLHTGTPYLTRDAIAALPPDERLLGYTPYQPGMALFGLPRAAFGAYWWTDARMWFAVVTAAALALAYRLVVRRFPGPGLLRAAQATTVLPLCALTLATGGDDIPVLALSLLAFAYAARLTPAAPDRDAREAPTANPATGRDVPEAPATNPAASMRRAPLLWAGFRRAGQAGHGSYAHVSEPATFWAAGLAIGAAGALKLFAWPIIAVLSILALRRRSAIAFALPAAGLPLLALLPALALDHDAVIENVVRYPGGHGLVTSPAQSPLPGHLIATALPAGRTIATVLLLLAALTIAIWLFRRPPRDAAQAALVSAAGVTAAIMLTPTTRFGYLLYPVAYVAAWWAIRSPDAATGRTQGR